MAKARINGIGGFFFRASDPDQLAQWYDEHLGINPIPTTAGQEAWEQAAGTTAFSPFPKDTDYWAPPAQGWMINFRVTDLAALVAQLRAAGIEVTGDPTPSPYGQFARLSDPEGNPIELWQPA